MNKLEMMGMLEKWLLQKAGQAKRVGGMSGTELMGAVGRKAGRGIGAAGEELRAHPKAALLGGLGGAGVGAMMAQGNPEADEEELLRAYGLR